MPMVTPTLNLPSQPTAATKPTAPVAPPTAVAAPATPMPPQPSTTVTLSPQALSAIAASSHPAPAPASSGTTAAPAATPAPHDDSVYESLKNGISTVFTDMGEAIAGGAHAVVDGVETTLSTANTVAKGLLELPFAALSRASDAAGALIDEL